MGERGGLMMTRRQQLNLQRLGTLHPEFIPIVETLLSRWEITGRHPLIVQARRTIQEQDALFAQGRTKPGPLVTKAPGGRSFHNYGLAIDVVDIGASGHPDKYEESDWKATDYAALNKLTLALGLEYGGLWRSSDTPHWEWHPGYTKEDAAALKHFADETGRLPIHFFRERGAAA